MPLSPSQHERYARQILLPEIGAKGQQRLLAARVLVIGAGGLGSPAALYLAAAGVGTLGVADHDAVELSNLQRQILHTTPDLGKPKALSACASLQALNPDVEVVPHCLRAQTDTIDALIAPYDFILDCTDNFAAKFLINDACVRLRKPFSHAGIQGFNGQLLTWVPGGGPCYRCVFPEPPPEAEAGANGVVGALPGVIGSLQAMEALKYILGLGGLLTGRLLCYEGLWGDFRAVKVKRREGCGCAC